MWRIGRSSFASAVLLSVLALSGCSARPFGAPALGPEFTSAVPSDTTYSFKVQNDTDSDVEMRTFDEECMTKSLGGKIGPHQAKNVEVTTKSGPGCESHKESSFTTSFDKSRAGDYMHYRFVKRTLSSWKLQLKHDGPRSTFSVELNNDLRVRIYKRG